MIIEVAIELIIPDNTAFTVLTALRPLGYGELERVERFDAVTLTVADDAQPEHVAAQLAKAEILFNPNKHRMSYALADAPSVQPRQSEAFVRDKDENTERIRALLVATFGMASLRDIRRAVGWRLYERGASASADRLHWACTVLLANPVSQCYEIRPRPQRTLVGGPVGEVAKIHK